MMMLGMGKKKKILRNTVTPTAYGDTVTTPAKEKQHNAVRREREKAWQ